ncbi:DUF3696 domain-containing protein [Neobacillus niacini]|uniref:DUF3696 domain-containing protein n=1 Tax=Neobacillus niacini TaxID=86668 RepID=UPI003B028C34
MKSFHLENIKGFKDSGEIELKPISIVIGQNSSGKSSVLRFPLVLRQSFLDDSIAPLLFYGKTIDYGNYDDVIYQHDTSQFMSFKIKISKRDIIRQVPIPMRVFKEFFAELNELILMVQISLNSNRFLQVDKFSITDGQTNREIFSMDVTDEMKTARMHYDGNEFKLNKDSVYFDKFLPDFRVANLNEGKVNDEIFDRFYYFFISLNRYFNSIANEIFYIGPFRVTPERTYRYKENAVNYVGADGEFAPVILAQDSKKDGKLIREVSKYLKEHLGFSLSIENLLGSDLNTHTDIFRIMIKDHITNVTNNLIDVGHGLSQLIPIIVQALMDNSNSNNRNRPNKRLYNYGLHIIEQPELHLHPAAQSALIDLFLLAIKKNKNKHFLIETHSEHMLIRLRRYIVEGKLNKDDVALYFTYKDKNDNTNKIKKLDIDENGNIPEWPEGFFEEDYQETIALRKAIKEKNRKGDILW